MDFIFNIDCVPVNAGVGAVFDYYKVMRIRTHIAVIITIVFLACGAFARADSYSTFQTTRYYSANYRYFVKVTPNKRATLYRRDKRLRILWSRMLPELPQRLFIANDGSRVVMINHYYGNGGSPSAKVLLFFGETGKLIASHPLSKVANLSRVPLTTSSAHWYYGAFFRPDQSTLVIETVVRRCEPTKWIVQTEEEVKALDECLKAQPYEELRFSMATGELISRADIQSKYTDQEKRLLHELELVENEHPPDNLSLTNANLLLALYYESQKQYAKAIDFYERAIPILSRTLGADYDGVAEAVGAAATNYRNLGDDRRAEQYYRRSLSILDKGQGDPESVLAVAITIYEEYAVLLRKLGRNEEAERKERRARLLRTVYPDYRIAGRN